MNQIVSPGIILSVADSSLAERGRNRGDDTDEYTLGELLPEAISQETLEAASGDGESK